MSQPDHLTGDPLQLFADAPPHVLQQLGAEQVSTAPRPKVCPSCHLPLINASLCPCGWRS